METNVFGGSIVALVTPFDRKGRVDRRTIKRLVEYHIKNGTSAILPCGTTGESSTLSHDEHDKVIEIVVHVSAGRIKVIAGTGSNSTVETIRLTKHAQMVGVDGVLLVCPYYNKPTQEGVFLHYKAVSESTDAPIIIYSIQGRTGINIDPETVARIADLSNVVGIKEASGNLDQMSRIIALVGKKIALFSGDDALTLPVLAIGGVGVISVLANIMPREVGDMVKEFVAGNIVGARSIHYLTLPLVKALFLETNPVPIKTAMGLMGMINPDVRLPLCEMEPYNIAKLQSVLIKLGLMSQRHRALIKRNG